MTVSYLTYSRKFESNTYQAFKIIYAYYGYNKAHISPILSLEIINSIKRK